MENSKKNIFITGKAGTGKSTLLEHFRLQTKKKLVVLAPTGVAALNVRGQTIHSFFGFRPDINLRKVKRLKPTDKKLKFYKRLDTIIIDEISMVRADLLDCIDKFMRLNGKNEKLFFGGVQMVFIGDLYQLPPVLVNHEKELFHKEYETPYFFSAKVFDRSKKTDQTELFKTDDLAKFAMEFIELEKIYRQRDQSFIELLNAVRNNSITDQQLSELNARLDPDFDDTGNGFYIYLTPTNAAADQINQAKLAAVGSKVKRFPGRIEGKFDLKNLPTTENLEIKLWSQVMMLNNDSSGRWVNGSIGQVIKFRTEKVYDGELEMEVEEEVIDVKLVDGKTVAVTPYSWEMYNYFYNEDKGFIDSKSVGSFTQYPLKLAWAVTIHKSQGKTFDRVILDIGNGAFAHGQTYVALSRCTSLSGLVLKRPLQKRHIFMDWRVIDFVTKYQYGKSEESCSLAEKSELIQSAIDCGGTLEITYLKANDAKSTRIISPNLLGEMQYMDKTFLGVEAFCHQRKEARCFRVERILAIKPVDSPEI